MELSESLLIDLHNKLTNSFRQEKSYYHYWPCYMVLSDYREIIIMAFQLFLKSLLLLAYQMDFFGYCEIIIINSSVYFGI